VKSVFALIGNAQPFSFLWAGVEDWGEMVHHICEALVKYLDSLEYFCDLVMQFLMDSCLEIGYCGSEFGSHISHFSGNQFSEVLFHVCHNLFPNLLGHKGVSDME